MDVRLRRLVELGSPDPAGAEVPEQYPTREPTKASLQRSKTDALDAETILEFAVRMPFEPWSPPAPEILELRALSRRIEALSKTVVQEKNRLHANDQSEALSEFVKQDVRELAELLEGRI